MGLMLEGTRRWRRVAALVGAFVAVLAGCGGGDTVVEFRPERVIVFGDELSLLNDDGSKYTANAVTTAGALDCATNPLWVQVVASGFGLVFPQCNPNGVVSPTSLMLAANGAKVADVQTQIDSFVAANTFSDTDLVTLVVGLNDVYELYAQYPGRTESDITAELKSRGTLWGQQINRVALLGPAVLIATLPDVSLSPYALAEKAANSDTDRQALIRRLLDAYDNAMRLEIINDGRLIGLVFGDIQTQDLVNFPGAFGLTNTTVASCLSTAVLPACTANTLVTGATALSYLWADDKHLGPEFQQQLGNVALSRARNSPF